MSKNCRQNNPNNYKVNEIGRREFIGQAAKAGFGYVMAPTLLSLLASKRAHAEEPNRVVLIEFYANGGDSLFAEFVTKTATGANLLTYGTQGVPFTGPSVAGATQPLFGVEMWNSHLYQSFTNPSLNPNLLNPVANPNLAANVAVDTQTLLPAAQDPSTGVKAALFYSALNDDNGVEAFRSSEVASRAMSEVRKRMISGLTNGFGDSANFQPDSAFAPARLTNLASYQGLFVPNTGTLANFQLRAFEATAKAAKRMSEAQALKLGNRLATADNLSQVTGSSLQETAQRFASSAAAPDPRTDARITAHVPGLATATDGSALLAFGMMMQALVNGDTNVAFFNLPTGMINPANGNAVNNDWDFHQNTLAFRGRNDFPAWIALHSQVLAFYTKCAINCMVGNGVAFALNHLHDGAHTIRGYIAQGDNATGDAGQKTVSVSYYYKPGGVTLARNQLGGYSAAETVDNNASPIAQAPINLPIARFASLMDMMGRSPESLLQNPALASLSVFRRG